MIIVEVILAAAAAVAVITYVIPIVVGIGSAIIGLIVGYYCSNGTKDSYDVDASALRKAWNIRADGILDASEQMVCDLNHGIELMVFKSGLQEIRLDNTLDTLESNVSSIQTICASLGQTSNKMREVLDAVSVDISERFTTSIIHELLLENHNLSDLIVRVSQEQLAENTSDDLRSGCSMRLFS